jgi:hypothetical protein
VPDGWPSPAPVSALMADYYLNERPAADFDGDDALRAAYVVASSLYRNRVPTYFVGRELLPSLLATDPPEDMAASDIPWPVPAALFVFPNGLLSSPTDGPIRFLAVARSRAGQAHAPYDGAPLNVVAQFDALALWTVAEGAGLPSFGRVARLGGTMRDLMKDCRTGQVSADGEGAPLPADDAAFLDRLTNIAASLLLVMAARPEMVESADEVVKRIKAKSGGGKAADDLWAPRWVGRNYRKPRPPAGGEAGNHASPRPHMRRGHWRRQRHGEGRSETKIVWIELTYVLAEKAGA